jgi:RNA polymerase sigma-70 factor (ECF subfamily)
MGISYPAHKQPTPVPEGVRGWFCAGERSKVVPPVHVRDWVGEIVRSNYRVFYSIAFGYVRNHSSAEDLVQISVIKGLQAISRLKEPDSIVGWLATITRNTCLEELRRKRGRFDQSLEDAGQIQEPRPNGENLFELQRLLLEALNRLPDNQSLVVRLRFLEDCDVSEIAERLGLRKNTVEVRLHRALEALSKTKTLVSLRGKYP